MSTNPDQLELPLWTGEPSEWKSAPCGFVDPPPPPPGYLLQVKCDAYLGLPDFYRHVPEGFPL